MNESYNFKILLSFDVVDDPENKVHMEIIKDALPKLLKDVFGEKLQNLESKLEHAKPIEKP